MSSNLNKYKLNSFIICFIIFFLFIFNITSGLMVFGMVDMFIGYITFFVAMLVYWNSSKVILDLFFNYISFYKYELVSYVFVLLVAMVDSLNIADKKALYQKIVNRFNNISNLTMRLINITNSLNIKILKNIFTLYFNFTNIVEIKRTNKLVEKKVKIYFI